MGIFDGVLICTNLDGTLLKNDGTVSKENKDAIEYFKSQGGLFTFVTGRMPFFVSDMVEAAQPNAPLGCINGAGLYDWDKQEYLWTNVMSDEVLSLIEIVDTNFPHVGIQVNTFYKTYFCKENKIMEDFRKETGLENLTCHYTEVKEPISKIVFGAETEEEILGMKEVLQNHLLSGKFDFVRSEKPLYEILSKGIGKGTAISKLCRYLDIDINKTVALGDYDNDISMLKTAKYGIAVSNACGAALAAADFVTVSNEEHAVARIIYDLESGKYAL